MSFYDLQPEFFEAIYMGDVKQIAFYADMGDTMGKAEGDALSVDIHFFSPRGLIFLTAAMCDSPHLTKIYVDPKIKAHKAVGEKLGELCWKIEERNWHARVARNINKEADLFSRPITFSSFYRQNREKGRGLFKSVFLAFFYRYLGNAKELKEMLHEYIAKTDELNREVSKLQDEFSDKIRKFNEPEAPKETPAVSIPPLRFQKAVAPSQRNDKKEAQIVVGAERQLSRRPVC